MSSGQVNKTLIELIFDEPVEDYTILDVGCGSGALSFIVAAKAKKVVGIDISDQAIALAKMKASDNTSFQVLDAETAHLTVLGEIDIIVSHLCMSDKIVENSYHELPKNGKFVFACFHTNHLIEGGRRSRFSYTKDEMELILDKTGFSVEYLEVETRKAPFKNIDGAIEIIGENNIRRWKNDDRLQNLQEYIENGGRTLTKSILVGKARKIGRD